MLTTYRLRPIKFGGIMKDKYYLLVTNDQYELVTACAKTLPKLSAITGISFCILQHSAYRKASCCGGKFRVVTTYTDIPDYEFDFNNYIQFCEDYKLKSNKVSTLEQFIKACQ